MPNTLWTFGDEIDLRGENAYLTGVLPVQQIEFPRYGTYNVDLILDGEVIVTSPLEVRPVSE